MRLLRLLTLRAQRDTWSFQAIMGTAHIAFRFRSLFLWYCHCLSVSLDTGTTGFYVEIGPQALCNFSDRAAGPL